MNRREWMDLVSRRVLVLDGGLATLLLADKVPGPGFCPEVFLLEAFDEVAAIHARYVRAGADVLLTNTFGGNRTRLQASGLAGRLVEINRRGVEVARRAAGTRALVAADMGPTGFYRKGKKHPPRPRSALSSGSRRGRCFPRSRTFSSSRRSRISARWPWPSRRFAGRPTFPWSP